MVDLHFRPQNTSCKIVIIKFEDVVLTKAIVNYILFEKYRLRYNS